MQVGSTCFLSQPQACKWILYTAHPTPGARTHARAMGLTRPHAVRPSRRISTAHPLLQFAYVAAVRPGVQNGGRRRAGRSGSLYVETMQIAAAAVQLIGCRRRRLTRRLPPPPESLAPARLGSGAAAPSPLLALTGGPNSLFIQEESTLKCESIFLSSA